MKIIGRRCSAKKNGEPNTEKCPKNDQKYRQMMQQRHQQRRLALRDGKSEEWIADIDDEMETLRKRSKALDEYHLAVTEIKVSRDYF